NEMLDLQPLQRFEHPAHDIAPQPECGRFRRIFGSIVRTRYTFVRKGRNRWNAGGHGLFVPCIRLLSRAAVERETPEARTTKQKTMIRSHLRVNRRTRDLSDRDTAWSAGTSPGSNAEAAR